MIIPEKITLPNGLRIILVPQKNSLTTTALILVETGSRYETKDKNGISHFLEHMCFKGTRKRPKSIDIAIEFDRIGADNNAFTGQEYTGYYAKARPEHLDKIVDVLSDIYLNSTYPKEEIEKEKGVIIEEINMYNDNPKLSVGDLFNELLYGDTPMGWNVAGAKQTVSKISQQDFFDYRKKHYLIKSTIVVLAGNFKKDKAIKLIKEKFNNLENGEKGKMIPVVEKQSIPAIKIKNKKTDQTHLVLGVRAFSMFDKRRYTLKVLSTILGNGMSSRLFQLVREKLGAAYYVYSFADLSHDCGVFSVAAGLNNEKCSTVVKAILSEFQNLKKEIVSDKELKDAKEQIIGQIAMSLETSNEIAFFYGAQELGFKKFESPEETIKKIRKVSAKDVQNLANDIFQNKNLNLAIIGPYKDSKKFVDILKI